MRDVHYDDIRVEELQDDFLIDLRPLGGSTNSVLSGVTFRNIRQVGGSVRPSRVMGRIDFPVGNVTIEGLEILGRRVTTLNDAGIYTNGFVSGVHGRSCSGP